MYQPAHFEETRPEVVRELMRAHPLAALVTLDAAGLNANHIPLLFFPEEGPHGTLRGHVSRGNPLWREPASAHDALAIFQGPQAYVSPSWYPSKKVDGKVVPTWNYAVVHAYGPLVVQDDIAWMRRFLERLTTTHESTQAHPWKISDAPDDYIAKHMAAVVGIEIPVTRIFAKWKVSQNRSRADGLGVAAGLRDGETTRNDNIALRMADLVEERALIKPGT